MGGLAYLSGGRTTTFFKIDIHYMYTLSHSSQTLHLHHWCIAIRFITASQDDPSSRKISNPESKLTVSIKIIQAFVVVSYSASYCCYLIGMMM